MRDPGQIPRWPFKAAGVVLVLGVVAMVVWANLALIRQTDAVNEFRTLPPRSGLPVLIEEPGLYTIWAATGCNGYCRPDRAELYHQHMVVRFEGPSGLVEPVPKLGGQHYMIRGDREGRATWLVEFEEAGTYVMERRREAEVRPASLLLGKGDGIPAGVFPGVVWIGMGTAALSGGLASWGWYRRRQVIEAMLEVIAAR